MPRTTTLVLDHAIRVGGGAHAVPDDEADELRALVRRAIAAVPDESTALRQLAALDPDTPNLHVRRDIAGARLLLGDVRRARKALAAAVPEPGPDEPEWIHRVVAEVNELRDLLTDDPDAAVRVLGGWADQTSSALGIPRG